MQPHVLAAVALALVAVLPAASVEAQAPLANTVAAAAALPGACTPPPDAPPALVADCAGGVVRLVDAALSDVALLAASAASAPPTWLGQAARPPRPAAPFDAFLPFNSEFEYLDGGSGPAPATFPPGTGVVVGQAAGAGATSTQPTSATPWAVADHGGRTLAEVGNFDPRDPDSELRGTRLGGDYGYIVQPIAGSPSGVRSVAFQVLDQHTLLGPAYAEATLGFRAPAGYAGLAASARVFLGTNLAAGYDPLTGQVHHRLDRTLADGTSVVYVFDAAGNRIDDTDNVRFPQDWPDGGAGVLALLEWPVTSLALAVAPGPGGTPTLLDDVRLGFSGAFDNGDFEDFTPQAGPCDVPGAIVRTEAGPPYATDFYATGYAAWTVHDHFAGGLTTCFSNEAGPTGNRLRVVATGDGQKEHIAYDFAQPVAFPYGQGAAVVGDLEVAPGEPPTAQVWARGDNGLTYVFQATQPGPRLDLPLGAATLLYVYDGAAEVCSALCGSNPAVAPRAGARLVPFDFELKWAAFNATLDNVETYGFARGAPAAASSSPADGVAVRMVPRNAFRSDAFAIIEADSRIRHVFDVQVANATGSPVAFGDWRLDVRVAGTGPLSTGAVLYSIGSYGAPTTAAPPNDGDSSLTIAIPGSQLLRSAPEWTATHVVLRVMTARGEAVAAYSEPANGLWDAGQWAAADTGAAPTLARFVGRNGSPVEPCDATVGGAGPACIVPP